LDPDHGTTNNAEEGHSWHKEAKEGHSLHSTSTSTEANFFPRHIKMIVSISQIPTGVNEFTQENDHAIKAHNLIKMSTFHSFTVSFTA
jgi:hypothetical protein